MTGTGKLLLLGAGLAGVGFAAWWFMAPAPPDVPRNRNAVGLGGSSFEPPTDPGGSTIFPETIPPMRSVVQRLGELPEKAPAVPSMAAVTGDSGTASQAQPSPPPAPTAPAPTISVPIKGKPGLFQSIALTVNPNRPPPAPGTIEVPIKGRPGLFRTIRLG